MIQKCTDSLNIVLCYNGILRLFISNIMGVKPTVHEVLQCLRHWWSKPKKNESIEITLVTMSVEIIKSHTEYAREIIFCMNHVLITGSLLDQDTKVSSGGYKGNSRYCTEGWNTRNTCLYQGQPFVVFGQTDRMDIYQFIGSMKITYCQISNVIVINLGSNME